MVSSALQGLADLEGFVGLCKVVCSFAACYWPCKALQGLRGLCERVLGRPIEYDGQGSCSKVAFSRLIRMN